jgi:hypothetical protein
MNPLMDNQLQQGLLSNIDQSSMPITYGLLSQQIPQSEGQGLLGRAQQNPESLLSLGAALLQASGKGMGTAEGLGYGLQAFSQSLANAEAQKQKIRSQQISDITNAAQADMLLSGGFAGTGFQAQMANMQARQYIQQGYSPQEARYMAGRDIMNSTPRYTTDPATGATIMIPNNPLPNVGGSMAQPPTQPPIQQSNISAPPASPVAQGAFAGALTGGRQVVGTGDYLADMGVTQPMMPSAPQVISGAPQPPIPQAMPQETPVIDRSVGESKLTPIQRAERDKTQASLNTKQFEEIQTSAQSAPDMKNSAINALSIMDSGFNSGYAADAKAKYLNLKGGGATPEEQKFASDYGQMERYLGKAMMENLKNFTGSISEGERKASSALAGSTSTAPEILRAKIMLDYVGAESIQRKADFAAKWQAENGTLGMPNHQGESFNQAFAKYVNSNPIITPELAKQFGTYYYVKSTKEADSLPYGTKVLNLETGQTGTVQPPKERR